MAQNTVNPSTLFHLVPASQAANDALLHPDNRRLVSLSSTRNVSGQKTPEYAPGLEVDFHVPSIPSGCVITRVGRDANLILPKCAVSAVHVAFEIQPETLVILLSVRSKKSSSVTLAAITEEGEAGDSVVVDGECVLVYGQPYRFTLLSYTFDLRWASYSKESLRELAIQGYRDSQRRLENFRSRDAPTEYDESERNTWYNTRLLTGRKVLVREADDFPRLLVGEGQFGQVYRAVDLASGNPFAVKVILLDKYVDVEQARAALHREVKALERLNHKHIIECLGTAKWHTETPEIFMPLRQGHLKSLAKDKEGRTCTDNGLCAQVLEQILSALDHLAYHGMCHRDVKPENILYWNGTTQGTYHFQLADFGLVNHQRLATTFCGTAYYQAPELYANYGSRSLQSHKMDVWSLLASILDVHKKFIFPPKHARTYYDILQAARAAVALMPNLADMAREDPIHRASAAQMLVAHFDGRGLTTPRAAVPPIGPVPEEAAPVSQQPTKPAPAPTVSPLIVYPRRHRQMRDTRPGNGLSPSPHTKGFVSPLPPPLPKTRVVPGGVVKARAPPTKPVRQRALEAHAEQIGHCETGLRMPGQFPT